MGTAATKNGTWQWLLFPRRKQVHAFPEKLLIKVLTAVLETLTHLPLCVKRKDIFYLFLFRDCNDKNNGVPVSALLMGVLDNL
jgi:hypothetical protein